jgi:hypothetical protein
MENNGNKVVEIRWQAGQAAAATSTVEKYSVLLRYPTVVTLASVNAGADPWLALSEVDPRYKHVFAGGAERLLVHIHAVNAAGMSDPLVIDVQLKPGQAASSAAGDAEVLRMFEVLRQLGRTSESELLAALNRFSIEKLKALLRCQSAVRLAAPAPPPSGLGNKSALVDRLLALLRQGASPF